MKKKNLVRKKQLYSTEIDNLCFAAAICHELFMFSEDPENEQRFWDLETDLTNLLEELSHSNNQFVEKIPLRKGELKAHYLSSRRLSPTSQEQRS